MNEIAFWRLESDCASERLLYQRSSVARLTVLYIIIYNIYNIYDIRPYARIPIHPKAAVSDLIVAKIANRGKLVSFRCYPVAGVERPSSGVRLRIGQRSLGMLPHGFLDYHNWYVSPDSLSPDSSRSTPVFPLFCGKQVYFLSVIKTRWTRTLGSMEGVEKFRGTESLCSDAVYGLRLGKHGEFPDFSRENSPQSAVCV